jgi:hypothetical protein
MGMARALVNGRGECPPREVSAFLHKADPTINPQWIITMMISAGDFVVIQRDGQLLLTVKGEENELRPSMAKNV